MGSAASASVSIASPEATAIVTLDPQPVPDLEPQCEQHWGSGGKVIIHFIDPIDWDLDSPLLRAQLKRYKQPKKQLGNKTKLGLCQRKGCREPKDAASSFCPDHKADFYYLDLAPLVNISGDERSFNKPFSTARKTRQAIINTYFKEEVQRRMKGLEHDWSDPPMCLAHEVMYNMKYCTRLVKHEVVALHHPNIGMPLCPVHLRIHLGREIRVRYKLTIIKENSGGYPFPDDVKAKLQACPRLGLAKIKRCLCRFNERWGEPCQAPVDQYPLIGFCKKHLHTYEAIYIIRLRYHVLEIPILIPDLRRLIVGYI
jgi:hypothetical protein